MRCEVEQLLGAKPRLDHNLRIKQQRGSIPDCRDLQIVLDPRNHLTLRLHHLPELNISAAVAPVTLPLHPVVLRHREPPQLLHLLVRLHVLHRPPSPDQAAVAVRHREEERDQDRRRRELQRRWFYQRHSWEEVKWNRKLFADENDENEREAGGLYIRPSLGFYVGDREGVRTRKLRRWGLVGLAPLQRKRCAASLRHSHLRVRTVTEGRAREK